MGQVGGWPCWRQDVDYPSCPTCDNPMTNLLFQLLLGDGGIAHVTQCKKHKKQLAFASACC